MTALHRAWLTDRCFETRERVSVLNLRHSLSTALVALRATNRGHWTSTLNVNRLLATGLDGAFAWLDHPTFTDLLWADPCRSATARSSPSTAPSRRSAN